MSVQEITPVAIPDEGPVVELMQMGEATRPVNWEEVYGPLGLTSADIPVLIQLLSNGDLAEQGLDEEVYFWAPTHAWRVLGLLQAKEAVLPLIEVINQGHGADFVMDEVPKALGMIGEPALRPLARHLHDPVFKPQARGLFAKGLAMIAQYHPELRQNCVTRLEQTLGYYPENSNRLNGDLIMYLDEIQAVEALPVIKQAYAAEQVDMIFCGDLEDVEIKLGLRQERSTPPPRTWISDFFDPKRGKRRNIKKRLGRNALCPCGSGKKYKKCCMERK